MYQYGKEVPQDYHKAMEFYLKSANQGNKDAENNYSIFFFSLQSFSNPFAFSLMIEMVQEILATQQKTKKPQKSIQTPAPTSKSINVEDWTVDDVINWMSCLNLSQR
jgi:TPR repeat protein